MHRGSTQPFRSRHSVRLQLMLRVVPPQRSSGLDVMMSGKSKCIEFHTRLTDCFCRAGNDSGEDSSPVCQNLISPVEKSLNSELPANCVCADAIG